jgi:hypothetical protein
MFQDLLARLAQNAAKFWVNNGHNDSVSDITRVKKDENFSVRIQTETSGDFSISMKNGDEKTYNISGSLFAVNNLVQI